MPGRWQVRTRAPLVASDDSEPEPDVTVIPEADHSDHHPTSVLLVVEVSRSGAAVDLGVKARVYASIGVPDYWVLDVVGGRLHAHRGATTTGYEQVTVHEHGTVTTSGEPSLTLDLDAVLLSC